MSSKPQATYDDNSSGVNHPLSGVCESHATCSVYLAGSRQSKRVRLDKHL